MDEYLVILKNLVEGKIALEGWLDWWSENSDHVRSEVSRKCYLSLKYRPMQQARKILQERCIEYHPDQTKCQDCSSPLFFAIPNVTTIEEIKEFACRSKLPGWETIYREGWLHPGEYCPKGCSITLYQLPYFKVKKE